MYVVHILRIKKDVNSPCSIVYYICKVCFSPFLLHMILLQSVPLNCKFHGFMCLCAGIFSRVRGSKEYMSASQTHCGSLVVSRCSRLLA